MNIPNIPKGLDAIRQTANCPPQEPALRADVSSPGHPFEEVGIVFDWEIPELNAPERVTFLVRISRGAQQSILRFQLDLLRLDTDQLEQVRTVLVNRHASTDDAVSVSRAVTWLLDLSVHQAQPNLTLAQRQAKVRELLLAWESEPTLKPLRVKCGE